jgi:hypothetical protein
MLSAEASFVRDVVGPHGSVTMHEEAFVLHRGALDAGGAFAAADVREPVHRDPTLVDLCRREQEFFAQSIAGGLDLSAHHAAALLSLRIVLAAERSIRESRAIEL